MKIIFVSPEVYPFSKTGGLGDVSGSLPKALGKLEHEIYVVTPLYRTTTSSIKQIKKSKESIAIDIAGQKRTAGLWEGKLGKNTKVLLIEQNSYFDRENLYGNEAGDFPDNLERFAFFCKSVLETCVQLNIKPDIIHCHDWQSALVPTYLRTTYANSSVFENTSCVFTIHNLSYQGIFPGEQWNVLGLDERFFSPSCLEYYSKINLLKGGIIFSDSITTVSSKYAHEIQTPQFGCGLEGLLKEYNYKVTGILNGVDYDDWDPAKDPFIIDNYSRRSLAGKPKCKTSLQNAFSLPKDKDVPLIGMISRIVEQKGFDILMETIDEIMAKDLQLVILGKGNSEYEQKLKTFADKYDGKMGVIFAYDNKLAHKIEGGADMFLMPSKFEPCGLNQMYSMKYGTIPIVTPVGGLDDTVSNFDSKAKTGNGFKMEDYSSESLIKTIDRAIEVFGKKSLWKKLMSNAMALDFSWGHSAEQYLKLFDIIRKNRRKKDPKKVIEIHPPKDLEA